MILIPRPRPLQLFQVKIAPTIFVFNMQPTATADKSIAKSIQDKLTNKWVDYVNLFYFTVKQNSE